MRSGWFARGFCASQSELSRHASIQRTRSAAIALALERLLTFGLLKDVAALHRVREFHKSLRKDPLFQRVKRLRDDVAHNLVREDVQTPVEYEDVYKLAESAEQIVVELFATCGRGTPEFLDYHGPTAKHARIFWDTYFFGMSMR